MTDVFISLRFSEAKREADMLKARLESAGLKVFLCAVQEGSNIARAVAENLVRTKLVVVLATETYGQETSSSYSTFQELTYIMDEKKPFFLVKMCEQYQVEMTRFYFNSTIAYFPWIGEQSRTGGVPDELVRRIREKLSSIIFPAQIPSLVSAKGEDKRGFRPVPTQPAKEVTSQSAKDVVERRNQEEESDEEDDERVGEFYGLYSAQLRQDRIAQLTQLLRRNQISQKEFDEACEIIATTPDPKSGGVGGMLCTKPLALNAPFAKEMAFEDGRVACELIGAEKQVDFQTYQEVVVFGIDIRFRDEVDPELEIGWIVSHRLEKFKSLNTELVDANGPLVASSRKKVPAFSEDIEKYDQKRLEEWLTALFKLVPAGGKQTNLVYCEFDDEDENEKEGASPSEKPLHMLPGAWRSVRDQESGALYYCNKITGETKWEHPFEDDSLDAPPKPKFKLLPDWEALFDKETGDYYFWNVKTHETTWEKPVAKTTGTSSRRKLLEMKDLLHVLCVNRFLDLTRNVQRMKELALT